MANIGNHTKFAQLILKLCSYEERIACLTSLYSFIDFNSTRNNCFTPALSSFPDFFEVIVDVLSTLESQGNDVPKTKIALGKTLGLLKEGVKNSSNFMENYFYKKRLFFYSQTLEGLDSLKAQCSQGTSGYILPTADFLSDNKNALFLSIASYTYFDLWIRPRQVFFPRSSYCSGAWNLWEEIDYPQFSEYFNLDSQEEGECSGWFEDTNWSEELNGLSMLKAIIIRMGEMGSPSIDYSVVDWNIRILLRYLGVQEYLRADTEVEFLKKQDIWLLSLFKKNFSRL